MTKEPPASERRSPLSADAAFVVHLTTIEAGSPGSLVGRVEHVRSGQSLRFGSMSDLANFMQRVLAEPRAHADSDGRDT